MLLAALCAAIAQCLLKMSAKRPAGSFLSEYLNCRVGTGYTLMIVSSVFMIIGYRGIDYKLGPMLASSSYVFVLFLSRFVLGERISTRRWIGTVLIVTGIILFDI